VWKEGVFTSLDGKRLENPWKREISSITEIGFREIERENMKKKGIECVGRETFRKSLLEDGDGDGRTDTTSYEYRASVHAYPKQQHNNKNGCIK
jgi:hypothetical protein